jgi:hypothetical protein
MDHTDRRFCEAVASAINVGLEDVDGIALSHLDVDNLGGDGFVLYANYKEADVAEETHSTNVYGESPSEVTEHYSGMTVEAINVGTIIRVAYRNGQTTVKRFKRHYDAGRTSLGHTWLPINIQLDSTKKALFCSFSGCLLRAASGYALRRQSSGARFKRAAQPY